jgi:fucose permease
VQNSSSLHTNYLTLIAFFVLLQVLLERIQLKEREKREKKKFDRIRKDELCMTMCGSGNSLCIFNYSGTCSCGAFFFPSIASVGEISGQEKR